MFDAPPRDTPPRPGALTRTSAPPARLTTLAFLGLAAGSLPLPILPPRFTSRIRGAVVHDVAARHGLSLNQEARSVLCKASLAVSGGAVFATVMFFAKRSYRRLGAMGLLPPLSAWLDVYALGLLFDRYLDRGRSSPTVRIDEAEARLIRTAIDGAVKRSFSLKLRVPARAHADTNAAEDLRDMATRISDGVLLAAAAVPTFFRRRLEAAFDEVLAEMGVKAARPGDTEGSR